MYLYFLYLFYVNMYCSSLSLSFHIEFNSHVVFSINNVLLVTTNSIFMSIRFNNLFKYVTKILLYLTWRLLPRRVVSPCPIIGSPSSSTTFRIIKLFKFGVLCFVCRALRHNNKGLIHISMIKTTLPHCLQALVLRNMNTQYLD